MKSSEAVTVLLPVPNLHWKILEELLAAMKVLSNWKIVFTIILCKDFEKRK